MIEDLAAQHAAERAETRLLNIGAMVARLAQTHHLHPAALVQATRAVAKMIKAQSPSDPDVRAALYELKDASPIFFTEPQGAPAGKTWTYNGRQISRSELHLLSPAERLAVINGERGVKL